MTEVDERIVAMHFDNKQFEKGAKQTIETLEKLRDSCDMEGAADSLNELGKAAKDLHFDEPAEHAEKLGTALGVIGKVAKKAFSLTTWPVSKIGGALRGLASDVRKWFGIDLARDIEQAAIKMTKALTIEPVGAGWNEYEMKMDSIKTIMSGTAKEFANLSDEEHMGKVKEVLEDLNKYADDTIYSFKDMTSNIGKFTNAGVKLDTAAKSMMGISNIAAKFGQGTQQASMAMYNFSQAMSLGYVELRDWRSIENANMAGLDFKQTLIDIGVAMGTLKKDSKGTVKTAVKGQKKVAVNAENLRDTLNKKWLTNDVLQKTLEIYSGNLSEKEIRALGNFTDEQVAQFMKLGAEAKEAATQVRTFSKMFDALKEAAQSGWAVTFEKIVGDMNEATSLWTMLNDRISGWMNKSAENRNSILNQWRGLSSDGSFRMSEIDGRQEMILALQNILDIVEQIGKAVSGAIYAVFGKLTGSKLRRWSVQFNQMTANLSKWLGKMDDPASRINKISKALKIILVPIKAIGKAVSTVAKTVMKYVSPLIDPILTFLAALGDAMDNLLDGKIDIKGAADSVKNAFKSLGTSFKSVGKTIWNSISSWFSGLFKNDKGELTSIGQWFTNIYGKFNEYLDKFKAFIHWDRIKTFASGFWQEILGFFRGKQTGVNFKTGEAIYGESGFSKMFNGLKDDFNSAFERFKKVIHWNDISTFFEGIKTAVINFVTPGENGEPSQLRQKLTEYSGAIRYFINKFKQWDGWNKIGTFLNNNILQPIIQFITPGENGEPSQLRKKFNEITGAIRGFIKRAEKWAIWGKLGTFFTNNIKQPIIDFITSTNGEPSKMQKLFENIKEHVTMFFNNVREWEGWAPLGDFFEKYLITPIRRLWNFLVHGDADYDEKKAKAHSPIGIIASAGASDVSLGKKAANDNKTAFDEIYDSMNEGIGKVMSVGADLTQDTEKTTPLQKIIGWINNFSDAISGFKDSVQQAVEWLVNEPWEQHFNTLNEKLRQLGITFGILNTGTLIGGTGKAVGGIGKLFSNLGTFVKEWNGLKIDVAGGSDIGEGFKSLGTNLGEGLKSFFTEGGNFFKRKDFGKQIGQIIGNYKEGATTSTERVKTFADLLIELAGSVALMVYAINSLVSKIKEIEDIDDPKKIETIWERFNYVMQGVMTTIGVTELVGLVSSLGGRAKVNTVGTTLIGLAVAIEGMVLAISQLVGTIKDNDPGNVDRAISILEELALVIGAFELFHNISAADSVLSVTLGGGKASGLVGFAVAIEGMVIALNQLVSTISNNAEKPEIIDKAILILTELAGLITAFELLKGMQFGEKITFGGGKANGLIGFAIAIEAMIHAVGSIAETAAKDNVDMAVVQGTIAEIAALITGFEVFKNISSIKIGSFKMGGGNSGLIGFILAIEAMVHAVTSLAGQDVGKIKQAQGIIEALGSMLTDFVGTKNITSLFRSKINVGSFSYNGKSGSGLIGFILALGILIKATVDLSAYGNETQVDHAKRVIESLGGLLTVFTAVFDVTSGIGSVGQRLAGVLAIAVLAGAIYLILNSVKDIAALDDTKYARINETFGNVSTMITGIAAFMIGSDGFLAIAGALGKMDIATAAKGGLNALIIIAEFMVGLGALTWVFGLFNDDFIAQIEQGKKVVKAIAGFVSAVWEGVTGMTIGETLFGKQESATDQFQALAESMKDVKTEDVDHAMAIFDKITAFAGTLKGFDPTIFDKWFSGDITLGQFADYMKELAGGLSALNTAVGTDFNAEAVGYGIDIIGKLITFATGSKEIDTAAIYDVAFALQRLGASDEELKDWSFGERMHEVNWKDLFTAFEKIGAAIKKGMDETPIGEGTNFGEAIINKIVEAINLGSDQIGAAIAAAVNSGITNMVLLPAGVAQSTEQSVTQPLADGLAQAAETAASKAEQTLNSAGSAGNAIVNKGVNLLGGLINTALGGGDTDAAVNEVVSGMTETFNTEVSGMIDEVTKTWSSGEATVEGQVTKDSKYIPMAAGASIINNTKYATDGIDYMTRMMHQAYRANNMIASPSKVFYDMTSFIPMAVGNSIRDNTYLATDQVAEMSTAMQQALITAGAWLNDDFTFSPVISPVVDMSGVRAGAGSISSMFAARYGFNAQVPSFTRNVQTPNIQTPSQNSAQIVNAITERLDSLDNDMKNLKIVLDTGALVGQTVSAYDRALGERASRSARG